MSEGDPFSETELGIIRRAQEALRQGHQKGSITRSDLRELRGNFFGWDDVPQLYESKHYPGERYWIVLFDMEYPRSGKLSCPTDEECGYRHGYHAENRMIRELIRGGFDVLGYCVSPQEISSKSTAEPFYIVVVKVN